jgi:hypothetical protein
MVWLLFCLWERNLHHPFLQESYFLDGKSSGPGVFSETPEAKCNKLELIASLLYVSGQFLQAVLLILQGYNDNLYKFETRYCQRNWILNRDLFYPGLCVE